MPCQLRQQRSPPISINQEQIHAIQHQIQEWSSNNPICQPARIEIPPFVEQPIDGLAVHPNALKCQVDPDECRYICRTIRSIIAHIEKKHGKTRFSQRGHPTPRQQARIDKEAPLWRSVVCQQFYPHGVGSSFFEVQNHEDREEEEEDEILDAAQAWQRLGERMKETRAEIEEEGRRQIDGRELRDASPWLKRTQWREYLEGCDRDRLLDAVEEPNAEKEGQIAVIWKGMDIMIRHCQRTVATAHQVGHFVKMEAVRTEFHQTRYQPLQPYMDAKEISGYGRPWKQVVVLIARTQRRHQWKSPPYKLNSSQRKAWKKLREAVVREIEMQEEIRSQSSHQEASEETINDPGATTTSTWGSRSGGDDRLQGVSKACLRFCITLLNQKIRQREYESVLVCALAVIGVKMDGWRDASDYPPILSKIIKIGRFVVVQTAMHAAERESGSESSGSGSSRPGTRAQELPNNTALTVTDRRW